MAKVELSGSGRHPWCSIRTVASDTDNCRKLLSAAGMRQPMSRRGNCLDNTPMESFFHILKVELVQQRQWTMRDEAKCDVFSYIEGYYNRLIKPGEAQSL